MPKFCVDCVHFLYNKGEMPEIDNDEGVCARDVREEYELVFGEKRWVEFKACKDERKTAHNKCGLIAKYYKTLEYGGKPTYNNYVDPEQP